MMQFQLRLFSTLAVVVGVSGDSSQPCLAELPKEHVALVQRHAATLSAKETEPENDSDTNLMATNTTYSCPFEYDGSAYNLKGDSAKKSSKSWSMKNCEKECEKRKGCTAFEVGYLGKHAGCWTFTGGNADKTSWLQGPGWQTCIKSCPAGYVRSKFDLSGKSATKSTSGRANGMVLDACADACAARAGGCTAFEYGWTSKYKGCWTYIDGAADIQTNKQGLGWTTCTVSFGRWTATRKHSTFKNGGSKVDVFCGKSTDVFSIVHKPSKWCATNHGGSTGQVIVNQDGEERSRAWYCTSQGDTELVGVPTFEIDDTCANEHQVTDDGN